VRPESAVERARTGVSGRTFAVTGASGYIGTALCARLASLGGGVVRVTRDASRLRPLGGSANGGTRGSADNDATGGTTGGTIRDVQGCLRNVDTWSRALEGAHALLHLAGETSAVAAEKDPAASYRDSVEPIGALVQAARSSAGNSLSCIVLTGSATQYGLGERLPVKESDPDQPASVYDQHKCDAEAAARVLERTAGASVAVVSARLANVYGPGAATSSPDRGVLTKMVGLAMSGETLKVFAPGTWLRDYIYIDDVVDALIALAVDGARVPEGRALVCSGASVTLLTAATFAAQVASRATDRPAEVRVVAPPRELLPVETRQFQGTPERLGAIGWHARVSLQDGPRAHGRRAYRDSVLTDHA
jgi:nucleoside-diphosphate-sugar epimerase